MAFNTALDYTSGDWNVVSLTTDTLPTAKTLSISDLDYSADYAKVLDTASEAQLANTTSATLSTMETLRFARNDVANVYNGTKIGAGNQMPVKTGVRTLVEANVTIKAVNAVSGEELLIPIRAWTCVQIPTASFISSRVMEYALGRSLAALFATGKISIDREADIAKGSLLP